MINLEEIENNNGFITVIDDDALVTIQMSEESVKKILYSFSNDIDNKTPNSHIITVTEFGETFDLDLSLSFDKNEDYEELGEGFHLTGSRVDTTNLYHDFELEFCDYETLELIKKLLK